MKTVFHLIVCCLIFSGCSTYFERTKDFQELFVSERFEQADELLDRRKADATGSNRLIYVLQKGTVNHHLEKYEESNRYFEEAYVFTEDLMTNYAVDALALLTNPELKPYRGEDFEIVLVHYFKALNYLAQGDNEKAMIECRRMNLLLNRFNDRYEGRKNRYSIDAFAYNLMGMIFEASGETNNAFVSYRNAFEAYEKIYTKHFGVPVPLQLKKDLIRTAYRMGFYVDVERYEKTFDMTYTPAVAATGDVVLLWHTGLGPVKDEWSVNFFVVKGKGGAGYFVNEELGLTIPFVSGSQNTSGGGLGDLKFVRVAFPKYVERKPYYRSARLEISDEVYPLEITQNINAIAFSTLEDRMVRELSTALLRLALKQAAEAVVRQQNANLGALLSIANALSEKADTRNWQILPYEIHYVRIALPEGEYDVVLRAFSPMKSRESVMQLRIHVTQGETSFHALHTIDSIPVALRRGLPK